MRERITTLTKDHEHVADECSECRSSLAEGDRVVECPRCRSVHHVDCWVQNGGCARHGCKQVMSPELRPAREEKPIVASKTPRWLVAVILVAVVGGSIALIVNGRKVAREREVSAYALVPAVEDQALWRRLVATYNETEAGKAHPATLILTPTGPEGIYFEQKLLVMIAAGDSPELVALEPDLFVRYAEQGALAPLDEWIERWVVQGIEFETEALERATLRGQTYGVPIPGRPSFLAVPKEPRNPEATQEFLPFAVEYLYESGESARNASS